MTNERPPTPYNNSTQFQSNFTAVFDNVQVAKLLVSLVTYLDLCVVKLVIVTSFVALIRRLGIGGTQNFVHNIYREKIPRYRVYHGTCFVIVVPKVKHSAHATIKLKAETCLICPCSFIATTIELIH